MCVCIYVYIFVFHTYSKLWGWHTKADGCRKRLGRRTNNKVLGGNDRNESQEEALSRGMMEGGQATARMVLRGAGNGGRSQGVITHATI